MKKAQYILGVAVLLLNALTIGGERGFLDSPSRGRTMQMGSGSAVHPDNGQKDCLTCAGGRTNSRDISPYCGKPLAFFRDSVSSYADFERVKWDIRAFDIPIRQILHMSVDTVGVLRGLQVIDLIYEVGDTAQHRNLTGKTIVMENPGGGYDLLYVFVGAFGDFYPRSSRIVHIDSGSILTTKSRLGGQMAIYSEEQWVWNGSGDCLCELNFDQVPIAWFRQEIGNDQYTLSHVHSLDLDSLYWWAYVKRPDDNYHWPSGGKVWVWLKLVGCELLVVDKGYDSTQVASH